MTRKIHEDRGALPLDRKCLVCGSTSFQLKLADARYVLAEIVIVTARYGQFHKTGQRNLQVDVNLLLEVRWNTV